MSDAAGSPISAQMFGGAVSNKKLLIAAFISFLLFAIAEMIAAFASNSLSLIGDASTMLVDAATYGLNLYCEEKKGTINKRTALQLEVFAPLFSVVCLISVSIYIIIDAFNTLAATDQQKQVNDTIMMVFGAVNLVIDILNCGYFVSLHGMKFSDFPADVEYNEETGDTITKENMNMASAWTHLTADTLRSIAVILAAFFSLVLKHVDSATADAWGSIFVTFIIIACVVPLIKGLYQKSQLLRNYTAAQSDLMDDTSRLEFDFNDELQRI